MAVKKVSPKLILASTPTFCPECKGGSILVSADGNRVVVRHDDDRNNKAAQCSMKGKIFTFPQQTVAVTEV